MSTAHQEVPRSCLPIHVSFDVGPTARLAVSMYVDKHGSDMMSETKSYTQGDVKPEITSTVAVHCCASSGGFLEPARGLGLVYRSPRVRFHAVR